MYCKKCGCKIDKDSVYCDSCGVSLMNNQSELKEKKVSKSILLIIGLILLGLILFFVFGALKK